MRGFGSDNHSGIHPLMLKAIVESNPAHEPSYGTDQYSEKCIALFKDHFGPQAEVHFVYNGTAANVLSLRAAMNRYETVLCSEVSHIHVDECGAPEFFAGKVQTLPTKNGKIILSEIEKFLIRKGDQHYSQPRIISITQPTELGTCYSLAEIKDVVNLAKKHNLFVHIDGARLSNAIYFLKTTFKQMIADTGIDIVSFGGTKNGFAFGEAVVILNPELQKDFKFIRKQSAQLPSKTRYIAHQFYHYLSNNNYLTIAQHSCEMAQKLHAKIKSLVEISFPCESNAVFAKIPKNLVRPLREHYFFYVWDETTTEIRLMTSWDTQIEDIDGFANLISSLHPE